MSPNLPPSCREKRNDYTQINPGMKAITQAISNRSLGHPQPLNSLSEEMLTKRATRSDRGSYYNSINFSLGLEPRIQKSSITLCHSSQPRDSDELKKTYSVLRQWTIKQRYLHNFTPAPGVCCLCSVQASF